MPWSDGDMTGVTAPTLRPPAWPPAWAELATCGFFENQSKYAYATVPTAPTPARMKPVVASAVSVCLMLRSLRSSVHAFSYPGVSGALPVGSGFWQWGFGPPFARKLSLILVEVAS